MSGTPNVLKLRNRVWTIQFTKYRTDTDVGEHAEWVTAQGELNRDGERSYTQSAEHGGTFPFTPHALREFAFLQITKEFFH